MCGCEEEDGEVCVYERRRMVCVDVRRMVKSEWG
jgi:hypothetical protein